MLPVQQITGREAIVGSSSHFTHRRPQTATATQQTQFNTAASLDVNRGEKMQGEGLQC